MNIARNPHPGPGYARRVLAELPGPDPADVYAARVLTLPRRRVDLVGRITRARVQKALWGYEVRMGRRRKTCPDEVTARYLQIFALLGLDAVWIPYNPVETGRILPELEQAFGRVQERLLAAAVAEPTFAELRRRRPDIPPRPASFGDVARELGREPEARGWRRRYHTGKRRVYHLLRRRIRAAEEVAAGSEP